MSFKQLDCCNRCLRNLFALYGRFVARHPRPLVAIPVIIGLLLGLGLVRLTFETDMEHLFTPTDSQAKKDRIVAERLFPMNAAENFFASRQIRPVTSGQVIFTAKTGGGMMNEAILEQILLFDQHLKNQTAAAGVPFEKLCARSSTNDGCDEDVFLSFLRDRGSRNLVQGSFTYPLIRNRHFMGFSVGDVSLGGDLLVRDFSAVQVRYFLEVPQGDSSGRQWEEAFLHSAFSFNSELLHLAAYTTHSLEEEFHKNGHDVVPMFIIAFTIIVLFAVGSVTLTDWVRTKPIIGLLGVCSTLLAILSSVGLLSAIGVKFSIVVGTMPVLLLGIGLDDMFILVAAWRHTDPDSTVEQRMSDTMGHAAVSVTITSLTDFLAFLVGIITVFPSVFGFCLYTAVAVLFDYVYQITFFAACLALDGYREDSNKHAITFQTVLPKSYASDKSRSYRIFCSGGQKLDGRVVEDSREHPANRFLQSHYGPFIMKPAVKVVILLLFAGYLGVSIYGCTKVNEGLKMTDLVADDSYASDFLDKSDAYFTNYGPRVTFVISEALNYWDGSVQSRLQDMVEKIEATAYVEQQGLTEFWLLEYMKYLTAVAGHANVTQEEFFRYLPSFLADQRFERFKADIKLGNDGSSIEASRFFIQSTNMSSSNRKMGLLEEFRDIADEFPVKTFPYHPMFPHYEQYLAVRPNTLQNVGIALVAMTIVAVFIIPHPFSAILIVFCIISIDAGVVGIMTFWGVNLDAVSMISIILCIGFSVDFSAHITYAYKVSKDSTRNEKTITALYELGWPTIQSALSTMLGLIPLAFANSYVFRTFFKTLFLVIGLGFLHGIVVLPVVLSLIGPLDKKKSGDLETGSQRLLRDSKWDEPDGPGILLQESLNGKPLHLVNGVESQHSHKNSYHDTHITGTVRTIEVYMAPESSV